MKLSPLAIIALVFAASFSGRAMLLAGDVRHGEAAPLEVARVETPPLLMSATPPAPESQDREPAPATPIAEPPATIGSPTDRNALLSAIRQRASTLDAREAELMERARIIEIAEKRVDEKTAQLRAAKADLESRLAIAETAVQDDISRLAKMYESMKPQKAGEIFNTMDPSFAAGFLTAMSNDGAALVLANMDTDKAYAASVIIAGRNAAVNAP